MQDKITTNTRLLSPLKADRSDLCGLRRRSTAARMRGLQVRPCCGYGCSSLVFVVRCLGSGLRDKLFTRPKDFYRARACTCACACVCVCVSNCMMQKLNNELAYT